MTASGRTTGRRALALAMVLVAAATLLVAAAGIGVRSTHGGRAAVDEPQYLITALSLWEDGDLDIADELAAQRWRDFHDADLPVQTALLADGRQLSPHDPLLPALLAVPMGLGGWVAAKVALAGIAALVGALTVWVAVRRFGVPLVPAAVGSGLLFASPPLAVYGQQVYPEMPAAACVLVAVAALTAPASTRRAGATAALAGSVIALPWLSVKFVPVAGILALVGLVRLLRGGRRREAAALAGVLGLAGAVYLGVHRAVWGGWTVYASGDHFAATGEFSVVGVDPDVAGRSLRLVGLLLDGGYGLVAWQPAWLLVVPAVAALARRRPPGAAALLLPLAAGWAVATWVALTMHGFWWPGRQVVVVLPVAAIAVLAWVAPAGVRAGAAGAALAGYGVVTMAALLLDGWAGEITWVSGFQEVDHPGYAALRWLLPDYRSGDAGLWIRHGAAIALLTALAGAAWWRARPSRSSPMPASTPTSSPIPAPARDRAADHTLTLR
jgi:hypothetical protein